MKGNMKGKKLKALIEKRNAKLNEMDELVKSVEGDLSEDESNKEGETRSFTEDELKKFEELKTEVRNLTSTIKAIEEASKISEEGEKREADGETGPKTEDGEIRAFANYIRGTVEERADVNLTKSDNGAVIPSSIANKIIKKVENICPIYQMATKYNVGGTLNIPYYDEATSKITMAYATEFSELESTSGKFLNIELKGFLAGVLSKISKSLINNSQFDIVNFVIGAMADSISKWIENELLNGTDDKIEGLTGVTQSVTTAAATALTADELIDLQESIPDVYQSNAVWIMSKKTRTAIRKFKDSNGDYILNKDATSRWGYSLFGKDVYVSDNMSDIAASKTTVYYGDFSGLAVKLSEDVSIEVLREKFATQHAVGVVGWIEIDSKVENSQKIAKLVQKSA